MKYLAPTLILTVVMAWKPINLDDQIYYRDGFVLSYNETHEQANWVFYKLYKSDFECTDGARRKDKFKEDNGIKTGSATLKDYKGSGYDRGHLKPSADESCDQGQMNETFLMSNMSPQDPSFNRGIWKKLESHVRSLVPVSDSIYVYTGGVLTDGLKTIGENKVSVPNYYYKVVYVFKGGETTRTCYMIPNKKVTGEFKNYAINIDVIERRTGLRFYELL